MPQPIDEIRVIRLNNEQARQVALELIIRKLNELVRNLNELTQNDNSGTRS